MALLALGVPKRVWGLGSGDQGHFRGSLQWLLDFLGFRRALLRFYRV